MKKCSVFHWLFCSIFVLPPRVTGSGNTMRARCRRLLAMKLKKKSSKSWSAAFGIGVSSTIRAMVSVSMASVSVSASGFLSVQPVFNPTITQQSAMVNKNNFLILSILYIDILKYECKVSVKRRQYKIKISFILRFI